MASWRNSFGSAFQRTGAWWVNDLSVMLRLLECINCVCQTVVIADVFTTFAKLSYVVSLGNTWKTLPLLFSYLYAIFSVPRHIVIYIWSSMDPSFFANFIVESCYLLGWKRTNEWNEKCSEWQQLHHHQTRRAHSYLLLSSCYRGNGCSPPGRAAQVTSGKPMNCCVTIRFYVLFRGETLLVESHDSQIEAYYTDGY